MLNNEKFVFSAKEKMVITTNYLKSDRAISMAV